MVSRWNCEGSRSSQSTAEILVGLLKPEAHLLSNSGPRSQIPHSMILTLFMLTHETMNSLAAARTNCCV